MVHKLLNCRVEEKEIPEELSPKREEGEKSAVSIFHNTDRKTVQSDELIGGTEHLSSLSETNLLKHSEVL